jgi:hypothetical protein
LEDKEYGRALIRREMERLSEEGKVKATHEKKQYQFGVP